jgi:ppGpp synthetase/RelA/SpoT-type nucleotidyltranferase
MEKKVISWYKENRPIYEQLANKVESILSEMFVSREVSYHMISSRAKTVESVKRKISNDKYDNPKEQIQDFAGIRVITYVEDEIETICKIIEEIFDIDKENSSNKSDDLGIDKVGYKSIHYVASWNKSRLALPEYKKYENKCFEIQIRTILQHAWAEIEHDRNYKFTGKLPPTLGRRFKILAGLLEMADREFNNISNEIDEISSKTAEDTAVGNFDIPLSSTTLLTYLSSKFTNLWNSGFKLIPDKV